MKTILCTLSIAITLLCTGCNNGPDDNEIYHMDKKYWTPDDYDDINVTLNERGSRQQELPNLSNPQSSAIFYKIVDTANIWVGAGDPQLGLVDREHFASKMFEEWKKLVDEYALMDKEDKYQYPGELVAVEKWGLYLQVYYITLGNQKIIKESDNPNSPDVTQVVNDNLQVLIKNYDLYLEHINFEDRFTDDALSAYADGIKQYFPPLITTIAPTGDYSEMSTKIDNMLIKAKNPHIIEQLKNIKDLITQQAKAKVPVPTS
jgi:hypothetical protein